MVVTTLGEVDEKDLLITEMRVDETPTTWVMARECVYIGTEFPEARNTLVRRDVWVTFKTGLATQATGKL